MSGKSARKDRQELGLHKFPVVLQNELDVHQKKEKIGPANRIDHHRRIRTLSKSTALTIQEAALKYARRMDFVQAPKNTPSH